MTDETRTHTPAVMAQAQRLGVDLSTVQGSGTGGRVTLGDVQAAQRVTQLPEADLEDPYFLLFGGEAPIKPTAPVAGRRAPIQMQSRFNSEKTVTVDVYGRAPLLEDAAQTCAAYALALAEAPAPTLFYTGDLPPMTASGVDPKMLLNLPWNARHYAASATSRAEVLDMIENCAASPDGDVIESYDHPGKVDYQNRVDAWLIGPKPSDSEE